MATARVQQTSASAYMEDIAILPSWKHCIEDYTKQCDCNEFIDLSPNKEFVSCHHELHRMLIIRIIDRWYE